MKPQMQLDPLRLKHVRERVRGLTQKEVAFALSETGKRDKSDATLLSMYQAIERTGRTSPVRAEAIAKALNVRVAEIRAGATAQDSLGGEWWYEPPFPWGFPAKGMLLPSAYELSEELKRAWAKVAERFFEQGTVLRLVQLEGEWSIEATQERGVESWHCAFRPARKTPERGIVWDQASEYERESLRQSLVPFIYEHAHVAIIDGKRIPPEGADRGTQVQFKTFSALPTPEWKNLGSRVFPDPWQFRNSLQEHLRMHRKRELSVRLVAPSHDTPPSILIEEKENDRSEVNRLSTGQYMIRHVWRDPDGNWQPEPWPSRDRDEVARAIQEKWRDSPIILRHEDEQIPPFVPDTDL